MVTVTSVDYEIVVNPLQALEELFSDKIHQVNQLLYKSAYSKVSTLPLISSHIIGSGGKRIRPLLTLAAAQLCGYTNGDRDVHMAACIEFLHTATLLHDDVVDESLLRRGEPTAHTIWGNQMSVLTGDFLFVKLFGLLVQDGCLDVLKLFVKTTQTIIEGEVLQINARTLSTLKREDYFAIIKAKTAVLFGAALELGGMVAKATPYQMVALQNYANNIGVAFQLIDDTLDYTSEQPVLGKPIGNDFFEGQITLPLIILLEKLNSKSQLLAEVQSILQNLEKDVTDFKRIQGLIYEYDVVSSIYREAESLSEKARKALDVFPSSFLKEALLQLTYFVINRCN
jgi:octaprenyl-diphosphate synthase